MKLLKLIAIATLFVIPCISYNKQIQEIDLVDGKKLKAVILPQSAFHLQGGISISRFNPEGKIDPEFGQFGQATTTWHTRPMNILAFDVTDEGIEIVVRDNQNNII